MELSERLRIGEIPYTWARRELVFPGECRRGDRAKPVRTAQEWLTFHGYNVVVDGVFGPATEGAVRRFQTASRLALTGVVDESTFGAFVAPMLRALSPLPAEGKRLGELVAAYAQQHCAEHPREVGGKNSGPWVRLYMRGNEGSQWTWCAGFVSFVLAQAARTAGASAPLQFTFSCDSLAAEAQRKGLFVPERQRASRAASLGAGCIFLNRRTATDWVHAGIVAAFYDEYLETIEGNTNDAGDREGYEVCKRLRSYPGKDFVAIA